MEHILLKGITRYKVTKTKSPENFIYNKKLGVWLHKTNKSLLVLNKDFPSVSTKKNDIETGEDQKGQ